MALGSALGSQAGAAPVPAALVTATIRAGISFASGAAAGTVSGSVVTLARGAVQAMVLTQLKFAATVVLVIGLVGTGSGLLIERTLAKPTTPAPLHESSPPAAATQPEAPQADARPGDKEQEPGEASGRRDLELRDKIHEQIRFLGIDDPKVTFQEALDLLSTRYNLTFEVNELAFQRESVTDIWRTEIADPRPIKRMQAPIATVLQHILAKLPAKSKATLLIRPDHIEITTERAARAELGIPSDRPFTTLVYEDFDKEPCAEALEALGERAEINLVLDSDAVAKVKDMAITARLYNVPLETALTVLTDMAGLSIVHEDNIFYVTTPEKAARLRAEPQSRPGVAPTTKPPVEKKTP